MSHDPLKTAREALEAIVKWDSVCGDALPNALAKQIREARAALSAASPPADSSAEEAEHRTPMGVVAAAIAWIDKAYRKPTTTAEDASPRFTRYNMEVAFRAGYEFATLADSSAKPVKMLVDADWLRRKTEDDPGLPLEIVPHPSAGAPSRETGDKFDQITDEAIRSSLAIIETTLRACFARALYATPPREGVEGGDQKWRAVPCVGAWRPMDTAPKEDRKRILVIQDTPGDFEGMFTGAHWIAYSGSTGGGFWQADLGGLWPTRWMPAPDSTDEGSATTEGRRDTTESPLPLSAMGEGWRPIETAPKDGTRVILCWDDCPSLSAHVELGKFSPSKNAWCNTYGHPFSGESTHWMPLPAPPAPAEGGE